MLQASLAADESSSVIVTTSNKEKYRCMLPKETDEQRKQKVASTVVSLSVTGKGCIRDYLLPRRDEPVIHCLCIGRMHLTHYHLLSAKGVIALLKKSAF